MPVSSSAASEEGSSSPLKVFAFRTSAYYQLGVQRAKEDLKGTLHPHAKPEHCLERFRWHPPQNDEMTKRMYALFLCGYISTFTRLVCETCHVFVAPPAMYKGEDVEARDAALAA